MRAVFKSDWERVSALCQSALEGGAAENRAVRDAITELFETHYELLSSLGAYCESVDEALAIYEEAFVAAEDANDLVEVFDIAHPALSTASDQNLKHLDSSKWISRVQRTLYYSDDQFGRASALALLKPAGEDLSEVPAMRKHPKKI